MPHVTIKDVIDFLVVTVLFKAVIVHWLGNLIMRAFQFLFVRTEREVALWNKYRTRNRLK